MLKLTDRQLQKIEAITGGSDKGTFARVIHPPVEGMVIRGERGLWVWDYKGERVDDVLAGIAQSDETTLQKNAPSILAATSRPVS